MYQNNSFLGRWFLVFVNSIIPYPVRSYFNLATKNAVFMRLVAFCKRLTENYINEEEDIYEKNTNERYNKRYKIF